MSYMVMSYKQGSGSETIDATQYFNASFITGGGTNIDNVDQGYITLATYSEARTVVGASSGKYYWEVFRISGERYFQTGVTNGSVSTTQSGLAKFYNTALTYNHFGIAWDADNKTMRYVGAPTAEDPAGATEILSCSGCVFTYSDTGTVYPSFWNPGAGSGNRDLGVRFGSTLFTLKSSFAWLSDYQPLSALYA